jgi:hypothetical protein
MKPWQEEQDHKERGQYILDLQKLLHRILLIVAEPPMGSQ